jgi:hypothetical protein
MGRHVLNRGSKEYQQAHDPRMEEYEENEAELRQREVQLKREAQRERRKRRRLGDQYVAQGTMNEQVFEDEDYPGRETWFYLDHAGLTQGPYKLATMQAWFEEGHFTPATVVWELAGRRHTLDRCVEIAGELATPRTAEQWKSRGNALFAQERWKAATSCYTSGLRLLDSGGGGAEAGEAGATASRSELAVAAAGAGAADPRAAHPPCSLPGPGHSEWLLQLRAALLGNRSACHAASAGASSWADAVADASAAVEARPRWAKAHWHLAVYHVLGGPVGPCRCCYCCCLRVCPPVQW